MDMLQMKTARELETMLRELGERVPAKVAKKELIARIRQARSRAGKRQAALTSPAALTITPVLRALDDDGRPVFDRDKRDALHPRPVMLVEQKGTNRFLRRHRVQEMLTIDGTRVQYVTTIKKRYREAATMRPVSAKELDVARHSAFATPRRGSSFFKWQTP